MVSEIEDFEDVEIPEWEPPTRMQCKHYDQANGKDICRVGGDRRIINDEWCIGCKKYEPATIEAPPQEHKETLMKTEQRRGRFDWDQPAKNYFQVADGITLREYLKDEIAKGGSVKARAESIGVTETALRQAISRELRPRTVIRTPLGINWEAPAVDVVGNKHLVNPCRVSLINWCIDCLDEECYTREELVKLIGCKPEDLQAALNKYLGDAAEDELDEDEPEAERSNLVTCYDIEEERKAREAECVKPENNIPADVTPEPVLERPLSLEELTEDLGRVNAQLKEQMATAADRNSEFDKSNSACFCGDACATRDTAETPAPREQQEQPRVDVRQVQLMPSLEAAMAFIKMYDKSDEFAMFCAGWNMRVTGDPSETGGIVVVIDA